MNADPSRPAMPAASGATPAMAQWFAAKADHPDALLFFRMGDFYELFFADAEAAAAALDIVLSHRGEHAGMPIPMCGVPHHASEVYLARLIRRGFRVAIVEQMEDPKGRVGKGPIKRAVVRVITPGTVTEDTLLEAGRSNLLLALAWDSGAVGAAWIDVSTGMFETCRMSVAEISSLLGRLDPVEILAPDDLDLGDWAATRSPSPVPAPPLVGRRRLSEAFGSINLDSFGTFTDGEAVAAALALDYIRGTQSGSLPRLGRPQPQGQIGFLSMDAATRASLEIHRSRDGGTRFTLLSVVQRTVTASGARLLGAWLSAPLTSEGAIKARQEAWSWLVANPEATNRLRSVLKAAPDMARALARLSLNRGGPRDLAAIRDGLRAAITAAALLTDPIPAGLAKVRSEFPSGLSIVDDLERALAEQPPAGLEDGGAIQPGFDGELDAYRKLRDEARRILVTLQLDYAQRYGVASLKIRHHAQLGYVIEAPASAVEKLRGFSELTLRQGMANGARFSAPDLSDLDQQIREAGETAFTRERAVFTHLVAQVLANSDILAACADALAYLDVAQSAAKLVESGTWVRPAVTNSDEFIIRSGRHPVVENASSSRGAFMPNHCDLSQERRLMLLTGPNMAGKSTFLRQNALFVVLAQAGLPVPAESAVLGIVDRLFSRVGAADDLARGRSTFMVEMTETAAILHQAGPRSFVVVDEIGRGTSTLDGLAIAWAVLEALHSVTRCRTIFATHFHELAELADRLPRLKAHTMRVKEWKGNVVFLHEVAEGAARRSWGVHVAELAGVPSFVVRRASALMATLEKNGGPLGSSMSIRALPLFASATVSDEHMAGDTAGANTPPAAPALNPLFLALKEITPDTMSPKQALDALYRLKDLAPACAGSLT